MNRDTTRKIGCQRVHRRSGRHFAFALDSGETTGTTRYPELSTTQARGTLAGDLGVAVSQLFSQDSYASDVLTRYREVAANLAIYCDQKARLLAAKAIAGQIQDLGRID